MGTHRQLRTGWIYCVIQTGCQRSLGIGCIVRLCPWICRWQHGLFQCEQKTADYSCQLDWDRGYAGLSFLVSGSWQSAVGSFHGNFVDLHVQREFNASLSGLGCRNHQITRYSQGVVEYSQYWRRNGKWVNRKWVNRWAVEMFQNKITTY